MAPPPPDASSPPPNPPPSSPVARNPPSPPVTRSSPPPPPPQLAMQSPPFSPALEPKSNTAIIVGATAGTAARVIALFAICLIFFLYKRRSRRSDSYYQGQIQAFPMLSRSEPPSPSYQINNVRISVPGSESGGNIPGPTFLPLTPSPVWPAVLGGPYKYEDLSLATNGFAELLGQGGFSLVYKGTINEKEVAIKKLKWGGGQGEREFRAEVEIISRVRHRNLVSLIGYCIHEEHRLLIYEYVPNKTLEFHLHGSGRPTLDWPRRWKIALGAAKGLAYLHDDCDRQIIHRDIKPANILLNYNFEAKVSNFGLAKLVSPDISHVSSSTRVMGTFGYMAPDYVQSRKLADRCDVYSYGVMLLELITGRKPFISVESCMDLTLVGWARPLLSRASSEELYDELVDPRLETNYDQYDMSRLIDCAAAATRNLACKRPRMGQIVRYLEGGISLEDLNVGLNLGDRRVGGGVTSSRVNMLRRMAFGGIINEDLESEPTSELNPVMQVRPR